MTLRDVLRGCPFLFTGMSLNVRSGRSRGTPHRSPNQLSFCVLYIYQSNIGKTTASSADDDQMDSDKNTARQLGERAEGSTGANT